MSAGLQLCTQPTQWQWSGCQTPQYDRCNSSMGTNTARTLQQSYRTLHTLLLSGTTSTTSPRSSVRMSFSMSASCRSMASLRLILESAQHQVVQHSTSSNDSSAVQACCGALHHAQRPPLSFCKSPRLLHMLCAQSTLYTHCKQSGVHLGGRTHQVRNSSTHLCP